jgi:methylphosphotriester-DNA--protein-cysteine methyltransferase
MDFLEDHLDRNIALQQVAEVCDLSVSHFARAFKQSFSKPPYWWLIERRVDKAKQLMMNSVCRSHGHSVRISRSVCTQPLLQTNLRRAPGGVATHYNSWMKRPDS